MIDEWFGEVSLGARKGSHKLWIFSALESPHCPTDGETVLDASKKGGRLPRDRSASNCPLQGKYFLHRNSLVIGAQFLPGYMKMGLFHSSWEVCNPYSDGNCNGEKKNLFHW